MKDAPEQDMQLVAGLAAAWLKLPSEKEIFVGLGHGLQQVVGGDAIITVSSHDAGVGSYSTQVILGLGPIGERGAALIGMRPADIKGDYPAAVKQAMATGRLTRLPGGVVGLAGEIILPAVCRQAATLFHLHDAFVVGFAEGGFGGGISIITRRPGVVLRGATIEALARLAAGAIERRRAQEALREGELKHRALLEASPDLVFVVGHDDRVRYCNPAALQFVGRREAEVLGGPRSALFPPVIAERQREVLAQVFGRGEPRSAQYQLLRDDDARWYDLTLIPLRDAPDGPVDAVFGIARDITERKQMEALQANEFLLRAILDATPFPIAMVDKHDETIEFWSHSAQALFGCTAPTTREWYEIAYPDPEYRRAANARWKLALEKARLSGRTVNAGEYRVTCRDRSVRVCEIHAAFLADRLIITFNDITDRERDEERLRLSEAQLSNALHVARAGHWEYDPAQDVFTFNDHFYRIFRTTAAEVGGYRMSSADYARRFCHPDDVAVVGREINAALATTGPEPSRQLEHRILYTDGETGYIAVRYFIVRDPQGRIVRTYGVNQDITERTRLQAQVAQADRLTSMGMMAAGIGHEINNPLTFVLSNMESLARDLPKFMGLVRRCCAALEAEIGPEQLAKVAGDDVVMLQPAALEDIVCRARESLEGAWRIRNITQGLSTFARDDRTESSGVDLVRCIESALKMASNEIKHRARLVRDYGRVPLVLASEGKLAQVFLNLIINAAHAIDEGHAGEHVIRIRTWTEGEGVFTEIGDTGVGIAPEDQARIFEPFFTTSGPGLGSGLGLAICRNLLVAMGGGIRVESEPGRGTRFTVHLPADRQALTPASRPSAAVQLSGPAARGRILVVDDEEMIRKSLVRRLRRDHEVVAAGSGREARDILADDAAFDLILCDLMMPEMTGMELHEWLVQEHPVLAGRTVFMTGGAFTPKAAAYLASVGIPRLEKPFDGEVLMKIVAEKTSRGSR